jgi:predicted hydrolase (HD superfamily)
MEDVTEAFRRVVERSDATPAQWVLWYLRETAERCADPVIRLELQHALMASPELLAEAQMALDSVGGIVAEAALARQDYTARALALDGREVEG